MPELRGPTSKIELRVLRSRRTASVREEVPQSQLSQAIGRMLHTVNEALQRQGVVPEGGPFARYHSLGDTVDIEAGVRVAAPIAPDGVVKPSELPGGPAAIAVHAGPYETLGATYDAMRRWLEASTSHTANGGPWELYITDPSAEPDPGKWLTEIIFPLKALDATAI
jgi:effector-binding domain-containing protein